MGRLRHLIWALIWLVCACGSASPAPPKPSVASGPTASAAAFAASASATAAPAASAAPAAPAQPVVDALIPTPANAGADPCRVGPVARLHEAPEELIPGMTSVEVGFGPLGGLVVWQVEASKVYTQRVDAAGVPVGKPRAFDAPKNVILKQVRGLSDGFLIIAKDFSSFALDAWFVWTTDAKGAIREQVPLDMGLHGVDDISPVVNDRVLFYLSNDRLKNQRSSRVILLSVVEGRVRQEKFDFPVVTPPYNAPTAQLALGEKSWAVWVKIPEVPGAHLLRPTGHVAAAEPNFPTWLSSNYHSLLMRFDGDALKVLTAVGDDERGDVVVVQSLEGEMHSSDEQPSGVTLRYDTFAKDGSLEPGKTFAFTPRAELPAPFVNELDFDFGSKAANRLTLIGLHRIGEPISLEGVKPPLTNATTEASGAWSSTHWVIAYWNETEAGGTMNVVGIRCGN